MTVRKIVVHREVIQSDAFGEACTPITRVAAIGVVTNPLARFEQDLSGLFDLGREVGEQLVAQAVPLLRNPVVSYGKAAIVASPATWNMAAR